jgi:hypothetical protein
MGRAPVDIYKLKELNRQFLQRMTSSSTDESVALNYNKEAIDSVPPPPMPRLVHSNSLSMMLLRGKQHTSQRFSFPTTGALGNAQFSRTSNLQAILDQADCELQE